ncbi:MAG: N-6 DNA methylase [Planctomycetes bacterium]|nr:N-6 DNA methylase [Planctomycetota bacterium]
MRRAIPNAEIIGIERDATATHLARLRLIAEDLADGRPFAPVHERVVCGDGLEQRCGAFADEFDVVVANPPYVRQERIDAPTKSALHARLATLESGPVSKRSDLFVYFFLRLREILAPGGGAAIVTSNSWLHTAYGAGLRRFLLRELEIVTVLETNAERWFGDAHVHGLVVVLRRPRALHRSATPVDFVVRTTALDDHGAEPTVPAARPTGPIDHAATEPFAPPVYRTRRMDRDVLARREEEGGPPWTLELRAPDVFLEILERAEDRLVPLGEVARVRFGGKTGANSFFYVAVEAKPSDPEGEWLVRPLGSPKTNAPLRVPGAWLEPALVSPRDLRGPVMRRDDVALRVLRLPASREALRGTDAERHVLDAERSGIAARPSLQGREPWWNLPPSPDVPLLHSLIVDERPGAFLVAGDGRVWIDANFDLITPTPPASAASLFASLASTFGLLAREFYLPSNLGQGALKANPTYLARLPVVDARRVRVAESPPTDRAAIDRAFLEALGVRDVEHQRARLAESLAEAFAIRRRRSR